MLHSLKQMYRYVTEFSQCFIHITRDEIGKTLKSAILKGEKSVGTQMVNCIPQCNVDKLPILQQLAKLSQH